MLANIKQPVNRFLLMALFQFAVIVTAMAQNRTVTGKITDSKDGSILAGATVSATGTSKVVVSDATGSFKIEIPASVKQLSISYSGYQTQEVVVSDNFINVKLVSSSEKLADIVVIGYGTVRKKDLTGSVATIGTKDFVKGAMTTPEQLIMGKVAGVQITSNSGAPGAGSTIRIRGGASLNASNDPLIVLDGMPLDNNGISGQANALALINPNDIESFSILKDASATAIYGSRASNGVIMITTKKGSKGIPTMSFTSQVSSAKVAKYVDVLSADEVRSFVGENGSSSLKGLLGAGNTNWQDLIYQRAISSDNNFSIR